MVTRYWYKKKYTTYNIGMIVEKFIRTLENKTYKTVASKIVYTLHNSNTKNTKIMVDDNVWIIKHKTYCQTVIQQIGQKKCLQWKTLNIKNLRRM